MKQYRQKPVIIEAIQFDGFNYGEINDWIYEMNGIYQSVRKETMVIETLEGHMTAMIGDYIIKGVNGEFYPCKPDIFEKTYEEV